MSDEREVDPLSLVGDHVLTGCDRDSVPPTEDYEDSADRIRFVLDGLIYEALEDPSDGYRSMLQHLRVVDGPPVANVFEPCAVVGRARADESHSKNDTLELVDARTGLVVLAVGTDNTDDYYPVCVLDFTPEAMAVNQP